MPEPIEIVETVKKKRGRPPKVEKVESVDISQPVKVEVEQKPVDEMAKIMSMITDLRSRIEAIELFRNPGAIEGRINELYAMLDSIKHK